MPPFLNVVLSCLTENYKNFFCLVETWICEASICAASDYVITASSSSSSSISSIFSLMADIKIGLVGIGCSVLERSRASMETCNVVHVAAANEFFCKLGTCYTLILATSYAVKQYYNVFHNFQIWWQCCPSKRFKNCFQVLIPKKQIFKSWTF